MGGRRRRGRRETGASREMEEGEGSIIMNFGRIFGVNNLFRFLFVLQYVAIETMT